MFIQKIELKRKLYSFFLLKHLSNLFLYIFNFLVCIFLFYFCFICRLKITPFTLLIDYWFFVVFFVSPPFVSFCFFLFQFLNLYLSSSSFLPFEIQFYPFLKPFVHSRYHRSTKTGNSWFLRFFITSTNKAALCTMPLSSQTL